MNGVSIKEKRDVADPLERWALVFEDREGGYVGRVRSAKDDTTIHLTHVACFTERTGLGVAQTPQGLVFLPAKPGRFLWLRGNEYKPEERCEVTLQPGQYIAPVVYIAELHAFMQDVWQKRLDDVDGIRIQLQTEQAAMGVPQITITGPLESLPPGALPPVPGSKR